MQIMAYRSNGDTSNIERVFLYKDSGATAGTEGDPITGLTNASTGLNISTIANNEATANTDTSAATSSIETITTLGTYATPTAGFVRFKEVDATNMPGLYELQLEDARYAVANSIWLDVTISGVADLAPFHGRIYLKAIPANVTELGGVAQSLTDLKDFADAGYDPATNKVQGVVLADTVTTLTGHTAQTGDSFARLGAPAGASVSADIATVDTVVDGIQTDLSNATDGLGAIKTDTAAILTDTGTTLENHLTDIKGATFAGATDSLEAIRDRGDAAWTTGAGGSNPFVLQNTTIATLATQVSFTLTAGSADDGAYVGMLAIVEDSATATQKAIGVISAYTGSTKTVTLREDPGVFTMAAGDTIDVVAVSPDVLNILADTADMQPKIGTPAADVSADIAAVKAETGLIVADTNELQTDWADAGRLDAILDSRMAEASINTTAGAVDNVTTVATTTTNTDMRGTDSAALASVCTEARLAELDAANIPADVDAVLADTNELQTDDIPGTLATLATSAALATVDGIVDNLNLGIIYGTAQTGTLSTTQCTTDLTGYVDSELVGRVIIFTGGTADGQASDLTASSATNGLLTFTAITTAPTNGDSFKVV